MASDCRAITVCFVVCAVWSVLGALCFTVHGLCFSRVSVDSPCLFWCRLHVSLVSVFVDCRFPITVPHVLSLPKVCFALFSPEPLAHELSLLLFSRFYCSLARHHVHRANCRILLQGFALSTVYVVPYLV